MPRTVAAPHDPPLGATGQPVHPLAITPHCCLGWVVRTGAEVQTKTARSPMRFSPPQLDDSTGTTLETPGPDPLKDRRLHMAAREPERIWLEGPGAWSLGLADNTVCNLTLMCSMVEWC